MTLAGFFMHVMVSAFHIIIVIFAAIIFIIRFFSAARFIFMALLARFHILLMSSATIWHHAISLVLRLQDNTVSPLELA